LRLENASFTRSYEKADTVFVTQNPADFNLHCVIFRGDDFGVIFNRVGQKRSQKNQKPYSPRYGLRSDLAAPLPYSLPRYKTRAR
jgi:hypothetical protein